MERTDSFEAVVLNPLLALLGQGFLEASEQVIVLLDRLFFMRRCGRSTGW
jgi:hypothetical protein